MFKKIVSGILATGILFSGSQAFAAKIEDFKLNADNMAGNFENEKEATNGHYYTFTGTADKKMKVDFKDVSADGDVFKITVRDTSDSSKIVFSQTANLNGFSFPVKKGHSYEIRIGVNTYKDGGKYTLKIYG
ncbi:hypothetical protein COI60_10055 [Bacillus toyonensis]|uniref:hypothetical protein n=1 Tax=Bacillus toyonensis TaxID=155322 RepID=UPI000BFD5F03|nr:hypothetical protein [Bacillus toyonensis]PHG36385.1 hypothetical protein COI60_10055 [Bacillus toyonensis]